MSQKNQKVAVVTDGASSLTPAQGLEYGIHVAPVYVNFSDKTYQAGVDLDAGEFYRLLRASKQLPTTAQPTAQDIPAVTGSICAESSCPCRA